MSSRIALRRSAAPRRFHGSSGRRPAAQLVDHQSRQRFSFNVFGDDQQRLGGLHHGFEQRQHGLQA